MPSQCTPDELCAIEACKEAARRYSHGVDRLDGDWMKSAYWPDATDDHGTFVGNAHELVDHCMETHVRWAFTLHTIMNHSVELDPDGVHARGEAYDITYCQLRDSGELEIFFGRYLDQYEKRDGEWRILHRVCVREGDRTEPANAGMKRDTSTFRPGSFDRPSVGRPIGP
jgi:SnoaL-like domain